MLKMKLAYKLYSFFRLKYKKIVKFERKVSMKKIIIPILALALNTSSGFASDGFASETESSGNCSTGATAVALQQVINELVAEGRSLTNIKFQASGPVLTEQKHLRSGDVLETYSVIVNVFDGTNVIDGIETPAKMSVEVVMRDTGAAFCSKKSATTSEGEDLGN